jgi:hypothetical protein
MIERIVVLIALILTAWDKIHERKIAKEQEWNEELKYIFRDMEV